MSNFILIVIVRLLFQILLCGLDDPHFSMNKEILESTVLFIKAPGRFDDPIFEQRVFFLNADKDSCMFRVQFVYVLKAKSYSLFFALFFVSWRVLVIIIRENRNCYQFI